MEENIEESIGKFFDIDEDTLMDKVSIIREKLSEEAKRLRFLIPSDEQDDKLLDNENFKKWNIVNLVLSASHKDTENTSFNRLIYFMYDHLGEDLGDFISQYDLKVKEEEGEVNSFELVILED
jgi:hypothetical protein